MNGHVLIAANSAIDKLKGAGKAYTGSTSGVESGTALAAIIGGIINVLLSVLGVIFLALTVYGGYIWMIARGDEGKVEQAKNTITRSVIGLVIILAAYAISRFVVPALMCATGTGICASAT